MRKSLLMLILLIGISMNVFAGNIFVKYRGNVNVDNGHFQTIGLKDSELVTKMYYDGNNKYLLVRLNSTYYHYCSMPMSVVKKWTSSSSLGKFYNRNIKKHYSCKNKPVPKYK